jgi:hypothetical protein
MMSFALSIAIPFYQFILWIPEHFGKVAKSFGGSLVLRRQIVWNFVILSMIPPHTKLLASDSFPALV